MDETDSYPSTSVLIFTDNQSAIKAINNPQGRSGQFLIEEIYTKARKLPLLQAIHWIPAHVGVPGNEWADKEVKAAAQLSAKRKNKRLLRRKIQRQSLPTLRSGLLRISKKKAQKKWEEEWNTNSRGRDLYKVQPKICKKSFQKYKVLPRAHASRGKIGLNNFLYSVKKVDSPGCPCGAPPTTSYSNALPGVTNPLEQHVPRKSGLA